MILYVQTTDHLYEIVNKCCESTVQCKEGDLPAPESSTAWVADETKEKVKCVTTDRDTIHKIRYITYLPRGRKRKRIPM